MKYIRTIFHVNRHSLSTRLRLICDDNLLITIKSIRYDKINLIFALKFFPRPRQQMPKISALQRKSSWFMYYKNREESRQSNQIAHSYFLLNSIHEFLTNHFNLI